MLGPLVAAFLVCVGPWSDPGVLVCRYVQAMHAGDRPALLSIEDRLHDYADQGVELPPAAREIIRDRRRWRRG